MAKSLTFYESDLHLLGAILEYSLHNYRANHMPSLAKLCEDYLQRIKLATDSVLTDSEKAMIRSGQKIHAIKAIRERITGMTLSGAANMVKDWEANNG